MGSDLDEIIDEDEIIAQERKDEVGMAEPGTDEYYQNAKYILSAYRHPNEETKQKLQWLKENGY